MSGHSKWSSIKHKKAGADARRSKIFTKLVREITVAAKQGGSNPDHNSALRSAIQYARSENMPQDKIKRALAKAEGGDGGVDYEANVYEGFAPGNVAVIIQTLTDNRNRTIANIRSIFSKSGATMGSANSVLHLFKHGGVIKIEPNGVSDDELTEIALEVGAEDLLHSDGECYLHTLREDLHGVQSALEERGIEIIHAELAHVPTATVEITETSIARQLIQFLERLEDDDDVQKVFSNEELSDEVLQELQN